MTRNEPLTVAEVAKWLAVNGSRLKRLRLLTSRDISRRTGATVRRINEVLRGDISRLPPSLNMILKLCNAFNVSPSELLHRPDDMRVEDNRKSHWAVYRERKKVKLTKEQHERAALMDALGLEDSDLL